MRTVEESASQHLHKATGDDGRKPTLPTAASPRSTSLTLLLGLGALPKSAIVVNVSCLLSDAQ